MEVLKINSKKELENLENIWKIKVATVSVIGMYPTKIVKAYKVIWATTQLNSHLFYSRIKMLIEKWNSWWMEMMGTWLTKLILTYHRWVDLIQISIWLIKVLQKEMDNNMVLISHIYQVAKKYKQAPGKDKEVVDH